jgi:hypothetical protein
VGCLAVNARPLTASSNWLTAVVLLLSRCRTGVARKGMVCRMKSCGLALMKACWVGRIIIMRVGCIARTRVALNMMSDVDRSVGGVERR